MAMNTGVRTMQALEALSGQDSGAGRNRPPSKGPQDIDSALSELANQLMLIAKLSSAGQRPDIGSGMAEAAQATRRSFTYLESRDCRLFTLPLALPLSIAGMISDTMMRGLVAYSVLGSSRLNIFAGNVMELYSEVGVYVSLQYKDLIDRHAEQLKSNPNDYAARTELGRVYLKCGLYDEATRELRRTGGLSRCMSPPSRTIGRDISNRRSPIPWRR
jgi:hypothetical protein